MKLKIVVLLLRKKLRNSYFIKRNSTAEWNYKKDQK